MALVSSSFAYFGISNFHFHCDSEKFVIFAGRQWREVDDREGCIRKKTLPLCWFRFFSSNFFLFLRDEQMFGREKDIKIIWLRTCRNFTLCWPILPSASVEAVETAGDAMAQAVSAHVPQLYLWAMGRLWSNLLLPTVVENLSLLICLDHYTI